MSIIWEMHKWGLPVIPQPESAAIPTIGSLARIYPQTQAMSLPRGLQIAMSTDGSLWSEWEYVDFSKVVTVPYPNAIEHTVPMAPNNAKFSIPHAPSH